MAFPAVSEFRERGTNSPSSWRGGCEVADGTSEAARALELVLTNDPGTGVMRHADAGYAEAIECAQQRGLDLPMRG